ncbi:MAG TPA: CU044_5270 family protein [Streptosporangiaceae bacterium]|nr:CU044_5270 family protein [Streptosporangiaceae bacterium]
MNEMNLLEEFRAVVAPPDEVTLTRARARVLEGGPAGWGSQRARGPRLPGSWPKLALTGLAAAATAAAVTVALPAQGGGPARPAAANPVVKELAYRVAVAAEARPNVQPGQWVYWQETARSSDTPVGPGPEGTFQVWTTANSAKAAYLSKGKVVFFPCGHAGSSSGTGCQSIGQPVALPAGQGEAVSGLTGKIPVSYADLSSLPSNPVALDRYLASLPLDGWGPAPVRDFEIIKELLTTYVMPPALTAELYRALGNIPGMAVDYHAVDVAGRHGIGFQITLPRTAGGEIDQLVLDPKTYDLMGQQLILAPAAGSAAGHVLSGTAILKTVLVSGPGILP